MVTLMILLTSFPDHTSANLQHCQEIRLFYRSHATGTKITHQKKESKLGHCQIRMPDTGNQMLGIWGKVIWEKHRKIHWGYSIHISTQVSRSKYSVMWKHQTLYKCHGFHSESTYIPSLPIEFACFQCIISFDFGAKNTGTGPPANGKNKYRRLSSHLQQKAYKFMRECAYYSKVLNNGSVIMRWH